MPIIYAVNGMESVAVRFRQQVNENGKQLCWHHIIPEMNHNELVGWRTKDDKLAVVIFRNEQDIFYIIYCAFQLGFCQCTNACYWHQSNGIKLQ